MSERGIMFLVVAALFVGAFLFPYENNDTSYSRPTKPPAGQKQSANPAAETAGPHAVDLPGVNAANDSSGASGSPMNQSVHSPSPEETVRQVATAQGQSLSQREGFPDGQWLEGTWVQVMDDTLAPADPASITFHVDGSFAEHLLFSGGELGSTKLDQPRADIAGKYRLAGLTLTVTRTDRAARDDPALARPMRYTACPLTGENARGLPIRLFIDGKVLKYRD